MVVCQTIEEVEHWTVVDCNLQWDIQFYFKSKLHVGAHNIQHIVEVGVYGCTQTCVIVQFPEDFVSPLYHCSSSIPILPLYVVASRLLSVGRNETVRHKNIAVSPTEIEFKTSFFSQCWSHETKFRPASVVEASASGERGS